MHFRRLIRSLCIALNILILAAWIASHFWGLIFATYVAKRTVVAASVEGLLEIAIFETGTASMSPQFHSERGATAKGWNVPHNAAGFFMWREPRAMPFPFWYITAPYWFIQLCALAMTALLWRITRSTRSKTAFPIEPIKGAEEMRK